MIHAIKILNWTFGLTRVYRIKYINTRNKVYVTVGLYWKYIKRE